MRELLAAIPIIASPGESETALLVESDVNASATSWIVGCHGLLYNLALVVPSDLFVAYLAAQARKSFLKLTYGHSYVMMAYYALLWVVTSLNLIWCLVQVWQFFSVISYLL
ncbi:hypothetical protein Cni_G00331 [Canna indica]|uniref:Uncharacterized protein n=1 Tax=Canna indica TaxID=4628 RepID=A0AAQ3JMA7_9LILI|nr:hypothetical protein Cni_G00331 [Canna indica]